MILQKIQAALEAMVLVTSCRRRSICSSDEMEVDVERGALRVFTSKILHHQAENKYPWIEKEPPGLEPAAWPSLPYKQVTGETARSGTN